MILDPVSANTPVKRFCLTFTNLQSGMKYYSSM